MPTFDTPEPIAVTIELALGDVHVIASDRDDTVVVVNPSDPSRPADTEAAERTTVELDGGRLTVRAPRPRGLSKVIGPTSRSGSVVIVIELPTGSHVESDAALGAFRGDGRLGDVRVKAGVGHLHLDQADAVDLATVGDVTIGRVAGDVRLKGAGELRVTAVGGDAEVRNLNGRTWVGEVTGNLRVRSSNGDITIDENHGEVAAKTANGNIQLGTIVGGKVDVATGSGRVEVGIPAGTAAYIDAHSSFGRVTSALENAEQPGGDDESTVEVRARTSFGDIAVQRA